MKPCIVCSLPASITYTLGDLSAPICPQCVEKSEGDLPYLLRTLSHRIREGSNSAESLREHAQAQREGACTEPGSMADNA